MDGWENLSGQRDSRNLLGWECVLVKCIYTENPTEEPSKKNLMPLGYPVRKRCRFVILLNI